MRTRTLRYGLTLLLAAAAVAAAATAPPAPAPASAATAEPEHLGNFKFRFVGPRIGNRIAAVAGIAGDASASTTPVRPPAASGSRATAAIAGRRSSTSRRWRRSARSRSRPRRASTVWAGTGEAWVIRDSDVMGNGIYKSTDAGKHLDHHGTAAVGPHRPHHRASGQSRHRLRLRAGADHRAAAGARRLPHHRRRPALGRAYCSRTRTSAARDSRMDAHEPAHADRRHVAGGDAHLGRVERRPRQRPLSLPRRRRHLDSASRSTACPKSPLGKIDVAIAPTNSNRVYALIQTRDQGSVWRSDDGGRELAARQLAACAHRPRRLLHPYGGLERQR